MSVRAVTFLVPEGFDDPARVSGGNVYDGHVGEGLGTLGWRVTTVPVADPAAAASALRDLPHGSPVLVDGLVGLRAADELEAAAPRLRVVVVAHMVAAAFADATASTAAAERRMLAAVDHVVTTSRWTAAELERRGLVRPGGVTVAAPGVEIPRARTGDPGPGPDEAADRRLLCVGVVAPHKGQDTLLAALARLPETDWTCTLVGSTRTFAAFSAGIVRGARRFGGRVRLAGVLSGDELAVEYRRAALLVAPSRAESFGMAIAEARGLGIPVVATAVGGIPDTVAAGGALLVPPDDPAAFAAALDAWMRDPGLRRRLRAETPASPPGSSTWAATVAVIARVLERR